MKPMGGAALGRVVVRIAEAVAHAAHGEDVLRVLGVDLELLAQVADVDVDGARVAVAPSRPTRAVSSMSRVNTRPGLARQRAQDLELDEVVDGLAAALRTLRFASRGAARGPRATPRRRRRSSGRRMSARRSTAFTRLRNSRSENGLVM